MHFDADNWVQGDEKMTIYDKALRLFMDREIEFCNDTEGGCQPELPLQLKEVLEFTIKETYNEVYEFMKHKSQLEIPTVQDNWISTIRWLETNLHPITNKAISDEKP